MTTETEERPDLSQEIRESAHRVWLAGLGALALAEEEGSKLFQGLVERGRGMEERTKTRFDEIKERVRGTRGKAETKWGELESRFEEKVAAVMIRLGVPAQGELDELGKRIDGLAAAVDKLAAERPKPAE